MLNNTEKDLITGILKYGPDVVENSFVPDISDNIQKYLDRITQEKLNYPKPLTELPTAREWMIPEEYKTLDIKKFLEDSCPAENLDRLNLELELFKKHDMLDVLRVMKYIVDTLRSNNIVWGVGRGSSVSSYCLYLLGIHKINSVKYNLPISEFFKGEEDG